MQRIICVLVVLAMPLLVAAGTDDDVRKELKALEGKWKAVTLEVAGNPLGKDQVPDFTFVIGAGGKCTGQTPDGEFRATITVNPSKKPRTIDNAHDTGAQKGKKQYGIYKLDGDKLTVCMTRAGSTPSDRPTEFTSKDSTNVVFVFERVKDTKKP
jgi:uncharacterized protein (TIGR03067 family)